MSTIVLIKEGKTDLFYLILGFDEFGGIDNFPTDEMASVLSTSLKLISQRRLPKIFVKVV